MEQDDSVAVRIKETTIIRRGSAAWSSVDKNNRFSVRVSTFLKIKRVPIPRIKPVGPVGFEGRVKPGLGILDHLETPFLKKS
jgi:hypothetical protein